MMVSVGVINATVGARLRGCVRNAAVILVVVVDVVVDYVDDDDDDASWWCG